MKNITINTKEKKIVISMAFEKKASVFDSPEYKMLQRAKRDNEDFEVIVKGTTKTKDNYKGLTFDKMEKYIKAHDEDGVIMAEFMERRGTSAEALEIGANSESYGSIRAWFLEQFPAIEEFHSRREKNMEAVRRSRAAKRIA